MVNWLWIGKCHLGLSHKQEAKLWLDKVVAYDTSLEEELEVCVCVCVCVCVVCVCVCVCCVHVYLFQSTFCGFSGKERGSRTTQKSLGKLFFLGAVYFIQQV